MGAKREGDGWVEKMLDFDTGDHCSSLISYWQSTVVSLDPNHKSFQLGQFEGPDAHI